MTKLIILLLVLSLLLCGCGNSTPDDPNPNTPGNAQEENPGETPDTPDVPETPTATPITWLQPEAGRALTAKQYFVYNCETGEFVTISGELDERIFPASITKLFTAYVALEFVGPEELITAGDELDMVIYNSSVAEIKKGDQLTAQQLVEAMLLPSGNDAAYVLATHAGRKLLGNSNASAEAASAKFVEEMNRQAKLLGMTGTNFANPDGIHKDNHYTTFADLAILGMLAMEEPTVLKYAPVSTETVTLASGEKTWENTNAIIHPESQYYCPCCIGLKTGQTPAAGSCLLSAFEYDGTTYLVGVFGCPDVESRFPDTLQLFNAAITQ